MGELRFFDLSDTVKDYNLDIFIETGTGEGGAIDSVLKYNFKKLFSIEIVKELYDKCASKFKNNSNIELLNLDSYEGLNIILNKLNKSSIDYNILFWLDAHFPGADFHYSKYDSTRDEKIRIPLQSEIELIWNHRKNHKDVFIIDDLRIYEDGPYELGNWPDRKTLGGEGIKFIEDTFGTTHNIIRDYHHQGYLFLIPK